MKKINRFLMNFIAIILIANVFVFFGCSGTYTEELRLGTPIVTVRGGRFVEWGEVSGATHYEIRATRRRGCTSIRESEGNLTETTFDITTLNISRRGNVYGVSVRAVAVTPNGTIRGRWSEAVSVTVY